MTDTKTPKFAIIETGGKQYKVIEGQVIAIERLEGELKAGDKVEFDKVILVDNAGSTELGAPYLSKKVTAEFQEETKGKKINGLRFRSKSHYSRRFGHRHTFSKVKITAIA